MELLKIMLSDDVGIMSLAVICITTLIVLVLIGMFIRKARTAR